MLRFVVILSRAKDLYEMYMNNIFISSSYVALMSMIAGP